MPREIVTELHKFGTLSPSELRRLDVRPRAYQYALWGLIDLHPGGGSQIMSKSDSSLVQSVRVYMKANRISQVVLGQEARISQPVISCWLSQKYTGHNAKVRAVLLMGPRWGATSAFSSSCSSSCRSMGQHQYHHGYHPPPPPPPPRCIGCFCCCCFNLNIHQPRARQMQVDAALRAWLASRRAGRIHTPTPDESTSILRPARAATFYEKWPETGGSPQAAGAAAGPSSRSGSEQEYARSEVVLAADGDRFYPAIVLDCKEVKPKNTNRAAWKYLCHYDGWNRRHVRSASCLLASPSPCICAGARPLC